MRRAATHCDAAALWGSSSRRVFVGAKVASFAASDCDWRGCYPPTTTADAASAYSRSDRGRSLGSLALLGACLRRSHRSPSGRVLLKAVKNLR